MDDAEKEIQNDQLTRMLSKYGACNFDGTPKRAINGYFENSPTSNKNQVNNGAKNNFQQKSNSRNINSISHKSGS